MTTNRLSAVPSSLDRLPLMKRNGVAVVAAGLQVPIIEEHVFSPTTRVRAVVTLGQSTRYRRYDVKMGPALVPDRGHSDCSLACGRLHRPGFFACSLTPVRRRPVIVLTLTI